MGMLGCFYSLTDDDLDALIAKPDRMLRLAGVDDFAPPPKSSIWANLLSGFGMGRTAPTSTPDDWRPAEPPEEFDVDKAWHGIHYLLTGTESGGEGPLSFLLHGGREIPCELGYGPPHIFDSGAVKEIAQALRSLDLDQLYAQADPKHLAKAGIYPDIWDEPKEECLGYVLESLRDLRGFVARTAEQNRALVVYFG